MALLTMKGGHQLSEMQLIQFYNATNDGGLTEDDPISVALMASGLPQFRDAFRALMGALTTAGWTFTTEGPDDGDSVATTRNKINAAWAGATPAP